MSEEKSCWICRRTESEILKQSEADDMGEYIGYPGDKVHFTEISGIYEGKFKKNICPVCYWIFIKMTHAGIKEMIKGDVFGLAIGEEYP